MITSEERVFLLNAIELCVAIFRGPDSDGWAAVVGSALPEMLSHAPHDAGNLTASLKNLQESLPGLPVDASGLETAYVSLFIAAGGGVAAPLYQSCHMGGKPRTMGESALAMRARLENAGLEIALASNEPADHLSIELEYLYHLLSTGWAENEPALIHEGANFAGTVMLPWVRAFREKLAAADPHPVYLHATDIVLTALEDVSGL